MRLGEQNNMRLLIALLLLAGSGFMASRVARTMHEISTTRDNAGAASGIAGGNGFDKMKGTMDERRDLRRAAASLARDPFRAPSAQRTFDGSAAPAHTAQAQNVATAADAVPVLRALVFDNVRPSVQLACEDATSPWLGQGDTFKGWTVLEIGPGSVWIRNGSRKQELGLN